jgi:hypothetical protein
MNQKIAGKIALLLPLALMACAPWTVVTYQPKPIPQESLADNFVRLMMSTSGLHPVRVEVKDTFALATYVGNGMVNTVSLNYADVKRIDLLSRPGEYSVEMFDTKGASLGWFLYNDRSKAEEMYDTLSMLTAPPAPKTKPRAMPRES